MIDLGKIEIDDNIRPIIEILNRKGYTTRWCCGGDHPEKGFVYVYITFEHLYKFDDLPRGYKYKDKIGLLSYTYTKHFDYLRHEKAVGDLMVWAELLPYLN